MTNSVVVLLVYLIPSANIRVLLLIVIIDYFLPHPSSPARRFFENSPVPFFGVKEGARDREVFLPHPSSPARRGSTSLLNPPILRREDLKPGRPGLYSQTSSRPYGVARDFLRNIVAIIYAPRAPMRIPRYADATGWFFWHGNPRLFQSHGFWLRIEIIHGTSWLRLACASSRLSFPLSFFVHRLAQIITDCFNI